MKPVRSPLVLLGIVVVVCGVVAGLALTPSIQRWIVLRAAAGRPGLVLEIDRVSAGPFHLSLRGVLLRQDGLKVRFERLDADYSPFDLLLRRLHFRRLIADGIQVDASRLSPSMTQAAAGAPAATPGLLAQLQLPVGLVLDDVRLTGMGLLPGFSGRGPIEAGFTLNGGGFAPGQEGSLHLTATLKNPVASAPVAKLNAQVSLRATQAALRQFSSVALTAVVDAQGRNLSEQSQLKITTGLVSAADGEDYTVSIDTLLHGTPENLLTVRAGLAAGTREYAGSWNLKARVAQIEPFFLGGPLPDFDAHGGGRFGLNSETGEFKLQGNLEAGASRLEAIEPAWRAFGAVRLQARFDVTETAGVVRLHQLDLTLAGSSPVLELTAAGAAEFNLREGRFQVGGNTEGEVLRLRIPGLPLAWVRPFVNAVDISGGMITGEIAAHATRERLVARTTTRLHLDTVNVVRHGELLLSKARVSFGAEADLTARDLALRVTDLAVTTSAGDSLTAQAGISLPLTDHLPITVTATYRADLPTLLADRLPLGPIQAAGGADIALDGRKIELRRLDAQVTDAAGLNLLKVAALRPFTLDVGARRAVAGDGSGFGGTVDLLRVTLGRLPLGLLTAGRTDVKLGGAVTEGEFVLAAENNRLTGRTVSPLKMADVSLVQGDRPVLTGLNLGMEPSFEIDDRTAIRVQTGDVTVRTVAGAPLLAFTGEATRAPETGLRGSLVFNLEVPALSSQLLFAGAEAVSQGRASGEIRAAAGAAGNQVEARITLNGLVARDSGQPLPVANLGLRAVSAGNGRISIQAPLLLDRDGRRSDLNFVLDLAPTERNIGFDGRLTANHIELADALTVIGVFMGPPTTEKTGRGSSASVVGMAADATPAWERFTGQLLLEVKSLTRGTDWAMSDLTGIVRLAPAELSLEKLAAGFGENSRITARGGVKFTGGARPYALDGEFALTEFAAGGLFRALDPDRPATVEGLFNVQGRFTGDGETLARSLERARGEFALTSRQGIFRGLQRSSGKVSMTSKAVELGASVLGSIFGTDKATKAAEKVAGTAYFVDQLAQSLGELHYDQLSVRLRRSESLNVTMEEISLVAPEIRLLGEGTITYVADKPLLQQPLQASLSLAGRGKIEELLGKLRLLNGTRDELDYARTRETVTFGGTLARPDPTAFFTRIASTKLNDLLVPEN